MTAPTSLPPVTTPSESQISTRLTTEETKWRAVLERDAALDGVFVYAVRSTGIYCRPSCPSRKPGREQVSFFPVPELAQREGFRPCKRCEPQQAAAPDPQVEMVREACRIITQSAHRAPSLAQLAQQVGASPYHLQKVFKKVTGISPRQLTDAYRVRNFKAALRDTHSVADATYDAGYGSSSRLYEHASRQLGMTPSRFRHGGKGARIAYAVAHSPLGLLLVAATERGVCAVSLGDTEKGLQDALGHDYPAAEVRRDDAALGELLQAVLEHLDGRLPQAGVPLGVRATAFERLVWEELQRIPHGETRSYSQVARAIGRPEAARAVARACSKNPAAVVIPCHRVVRQDGGPGGYRWGVERKQALLVRERELSHENLPL